MNRKLHFSRLSKRVDRAIRVPDGAAAGTDSATQLAEHPLQLNGEAGVAEAPARDGNGNAPVEATSPPPVNGAGARADTANGRAATAGARLRILRLPRAGLRLRDRIAAFARSNPTLAFAAGVALATAIIAAGVAIAGDNDKTGSGKQPQALGPPTGGDADSPTGVVPGLPAAPAPGERTSPGGAPPAGSGSSGQGGFAALFDLLGIESTGAPASGSPAPVFQTLLALIGVDTKSLTGAGAQTKSGKPRSGSPAAPAVPKSSPLGNSSPAGTATPTPAPAAEPPAVPLPKAPSTPPSPKKPSPTGAPETRTSSVVTYIAEAGDKNKVIVSRAAGKYRLKDSGAAATSPASGCTASGSKTQVCPADGIEHFQIRTGDRDDRVMLKVSTPATILGEAGADRLTAGKGADILYGGSGLDVLDGAKGDDVLHGGKDDDSLSGGSGDDTLSGSSGNDTLDGGAGEDTLAGDAGNDKISARDGAADRIRCGQGDDSVTADANDVVAADCEHVVVL